MKTMWTVLSGIAGIAAVGLTTAPTLACETDADCGAGHVCETVTYDSPCSVDRPDCAPDDVDCQLAQDEELETCESEPVTSSSCSRAACEVDSDCGPDMVCIERTTQWCSGGGYVECDEDGICESVEVEEECGTDVYKECGYRYEGACEADADCGEGFNCVAQEYCYCSSPAYPDDGGGAAGGAGPLPDEEPGEAECGCEPSGEFRCELQELPCAQDSDCPASLVCNSYSTGACSVDPEGNVECSEETSSRCEPASWGGSDDAEDGLGESGGDLVGDPGEEGPADGTGDSTGADGGSTDGDDGNEPPGWEPPHGPHVPWGHGFGCTVSSPASSPLSGAGLAGLIGVAFFAARRRRSAP